MPTPAQEADDIMGALDSEPTSQQEAQSEAQDEETQGTPPPPGSLSVSSSQSSSVRDPERASQSDLAYKEVQDALRDKEEAVKGVEDAYKESDKLRDESDEAKSDALQEHRAELEPFRLQAAEIAQKHAEAVEIMAQRRQNMLQKIDLMQQQANNLEQMEIRGNWVQTNPIGGALAALGAGLGAIAGSGPGGVGGNPFLEALNSGIAQDLQLQKLRIEKARDDYANKRLLLNQFIQTGAHVDEAVEMAHLSALNAVQKRIDYLASRVTNKDVQANIAQNRALVAKEIADRSAKLVTNYKGAAVRDHLAGGQLAAQRDAAGTALRKAELKASSGPYKPGEIVQKTFEDIRRFRSEPTAAQATKDIYAAQKATAILKPYVGDYNKVPAVVKSELVQELGKIAAGGIGSDASRESLDAQTYRSTFAKFMEKVKGEPTGAQLGAFIKLHERYLNQLSKDAKQVLKDRTERIISGRRKQLAPGEEDYIRKELNKEIPELGE